jgi:hypothetical protein
MNVPLPICQNRAEPGFNSQRVKTYLETLNILDGKKDLSSG